MASQQKSADHSFKTQLLNYKKLIDADINDFAETFVERARSRYGGNAGLVALAYNDILKRDAKRIRGALTIVGYEMCGGTNPEIAIQAARAVEMMHAYMLIIDDIQDNSDMRRGGPSAHRIIESLHTKNGWKADPEHIGRSLALNAAIIGAHNAEMVLANMEIDPELRLKALMIINNTMMVTAYGQTEDIVNQVNTSVAADNIENMMLWKTAHYTILNPIHMGMVMANAGCEDTNAITEYALNIGKVFQIRDDLLVATSKSDSGKQAIDDIREGKQTLLTIHAFEHANKADADFLKNSLGSTELSEADFKRCRDIFTKAGSIDYARSVAEKYVAEGRRSLKYHSSRWPAKQVKFLDDLAGYMIAWS